MRYYGGERVAISGIYHSAHLFHREHDADLSLSVGEFFPHCGTDCSDVMYVLIKTAPSLQEARKLNLPPEPSKNGSRAA